MQLQERRLNNTAPKNTPPWLLLIVMLTSVVVHAQQPQAGETAPSKVDIFAGYSIWLPGATVDRTPFPNDIHGALVSGAYYLNTTVGFELAGDYHFEDANDSLVSFAVGPVVRRPVWRNFSMFAHAMAGAGDVIGPVAPVVGKGYYQQLGAAWGPQLTLGGGLDFRLPYFHHRLSLRLFQADYVYEHVDFGPTGGVGNLNSARYSTGIVWRLGSVLPPPAVRFACTATPQKIFPGDPVSVIGAATNLDAKKPVTFHWMGDGVRALESKPIAEVDSSGLAAGTYKVTGQVSEGNKPGQSAYCAAAFTVMAFAAPSLSCSANPAIVRPAETVTISAHGISPQNRPLQFGFISSAGSITPKGHEATLRLADVRPGVITIACNVSDDQQQIASATTTVTVLAPAAAGAKTRALCSVDFGRDAKRPARLDNEGKACLDEVATDAKQYPESRLVLVGGDAPRSALRGETEVLAVKRSIDARDYLVNDKGIDPQRIQVRKGNAGSTELNAYLVAAGADFERDVPGTTIIEEAAQP
jgi:hypothetical protein